MFGSPFSGDTGSPVMYNVYSCGDGNVLEHQTQCLDREAVNIGQLIQANNPQYRVGIVKCKLKLTKLKLT
ncbi:hypothetical protein DPMN_100799 [Dreissena polymorpha]|uniref:Uncharacterized protein n=1 Tax=Dreissena polymorpha TaxID=45954 RepID=A0A9D4R7R8_DREPO|nr:hypothetical protein DPMN_100799 [Dreissena polymorpha]